MTSDERHHDRGARCGIDVPGRLLGVEHDVLEVVAARAAIDFGPAVAIPVVGEEDRVVAAAADRVSSQQPQQIVAVAAVERGSRLLLPGENRKTPAYAGLPPSRAPGFAAMRTRVCSPGA
jgi:hypothetical protein